MVDTISTDYTGRQTDLLAMDAVFSRSSRRTRLVFPEPPTVIAGVQAAVQSFLSLFLTKEGTSRKATAGTTFMALLRTRPPRNTVDVRTYYNLTVGDSIRQHNAGATLPDERIASAALLEAFVDVDSIRLTISVVTEAGTSATFLAPLEGV